MPKLVIRLSTLHPIFASVRWLGRDSMRVDGGLTSDKLKAASQPQFMETIDAMHRPPRSTEGRRPRGG